MSIQIYDEPIDYTATWVNTVAAGAVVAGFTVPVTAILIAGASTKWSLFQGDRMKA